MTSSVMLTARQIADRYDRMSFSEFMKSSGVEVSIHAALASGLSEEVYAAQGWELLNALHAPGLRFHLQAYSGDHLLFAEDWTVGLHPYPATQQMILDHIKSNRDYINPTPIYHSVISNDLILGRHGPLLLPMPQ